MRYLLCAIPLLIVSCTESKAPEIITPALPGGAGSHMESWYWSRAYPSGSIAMEHYSAAFNKAHLMAENHRGPGANWQAIGPKNFGGRTLILAFNPQNENTLWAGSASGGLWRSFSAGLGSTAWHQVELGFPANSISALAIHPTDSNIIYIGTGEVYNINHGGTGYAAWSSRGFYGIGILKSTDGGNTWTKSLDWSIGMLRGVGMLKINPLNPDVIWAGTSDGTYRSVNAGGSWDKVHNTRLVTDIIVHPQDTGTAIIACGDLGSPGAGLYRTTNSGSSWTALGGGNGLVSYFGKAMLGICDESPDNMYASLGYGSDQLFRSTDKGVNWTALSTDNYTYGWFAHDVAINPKDPNDVVCAGTEIFKWDPSTGDLIKKSFWWKWDMSATPIGGPEGPPDYAHADIHDIIYHPSDTSTLYFATDGGIFRSTDGGETFSGHNGLYQTQQFYTGWANSATDPDFGIGGLQDNSTAVYEGNLAWRRVVGGDGGQNAISHADDNIVYVSTQWSNHYKSVNRADSFDWMAGVDYFGSSVNFIAPFVMDPNDPNVLYAGRDTIYKSTDGGDNWTRIAELDDGRPALAIAIAPSSSNVLYASSTPIVGSGLGITSVPPSGLLKSTTGGTFWTNVTGTLPDRFYNDIAVHPADESTAYVVLGGYGSSHVYKTTDGGTNWNDVDGGSLPDLPVNCVFIDPLQPDHIYIGNDLGVFFSLDGGANWSNYSDGLPEAVIVYDITMNADRKLRIATHGNGAYDGDAVHQPVGIRETPAIDVHVFPNPFSAELAISAPVNAMVKIYAESGSLVAERKMDGDLRLNTSLWAAGAYLIEVHADGHTQVRKVVKN